MSSSQKLTISNELFLKFHQLQINLIKTTSKETIIEYNKNLISLLEHEFSFNEETTESIKLLEFLIYPILNVLKRFQLNSDSNEILIKSLILILEKIKLFDHKVFIEILNISSILLSKNKLSTNQTKSSQSEEFLCTCFKLIQTLFKRSSRPKILDKFFTFESLTSIGLLTSILLDTLTETTSIDVRFEALNTLKNLTGFSSKSYHDGRITQPHRCSIILASFLPGLSIKLIQKFLMGQNLKLINHKLIVSTLDLFGHVISLVFNDYLLDDTNYKTCFDLCSNESMTLNNEIRGLIVDRRQSKNWIEKSSEKIFFLIERLVDALIINDNFNVQLSLVKFCGIVSNQCYFTLNKYLPKILKILVTFASNEDEKLSVPASRAINLLEEKEIKNNGDEKYVVHNKFSILDSCFEEILIKLPRIMKTKIGQKTELNDEFKLSHLKTLYGYLKLVGDEQLKNFFTLNSGNLSHLIEGLLSCVQFDFKSLNNFYEIDNRDDLMKNSEGLSNYTGLKTYLEDKVLYDQLLLICTYLGKSDSIRLLIDELLTRDLVCSNGFLKLEVMFVINLLLIGLKEQKLDHDESYSIISLILTNFLNDFTSLTEDRLEEVESLTVSNKNQIILQTCLTLESIHLSSKLVENFDLFLIDTLYFILENYLNSNLLIRVVSTQCLIELASNLRYKNIQDLLSINFDYIMNDLILKSNSQNRCLNSHEDVNEDDLNKQTGHVFVLCALLEISNYDIIPYLNRLLDEFFFNIQINPNEVRLVLGVCRIMTSMAKSIRRWYPLKFNFIDETTIKHQDEFMNLNLMKLAEARKKPGYTKSFSEIINEINASLKSNPWESDEKEEVQDEEKKQIPLYIQLQTRCLELCIHLISHPFRQVRIQIIDLARELCKNLAEHTNEFLPLVHKLWSPICHRFSLDDLVVKSKIISLLFDLSVLCPDFISSRFTKEFLPRLNLFMKDQSKISARSSKLNGPGDSTYIYSHAFKLQCSILSNLDKMCVLFEIKEIELENLIDSCVLVYLDQVQPIRLQQLAVNACKNCALIDSDIVWLSLHYVIPFKQIQTNENYSTQIKMKYNFKFNDETLSSLLRLFNQI